MFNIYVCVCMYVCVYVCVRMCVYMFIYVCMYVYVYYIQDASVNRAILQLCFFLVRQHWGGSRYRHSADNFKAF
jgi:hypothetical protein